MRPMAWRAASAMAATVICGAIALSACWGAADPAPQSSGAGTGATTAPSVSNSSSPTSSTMPASTSTTTAALKGTVTVLEIGDSLGEDLGIGLENVLAGSPKVRLLSDAVGDTGLSNEGYYNWPVHLQADLAQYHPQIVVVLLGGNDMQGFANGNTIEQVGSPGWKAVYAARVRQILDESTAARARVLWVGLPIMESPSFSAEMAGLNSIYRAQVSGHPGATYFPSWNLFANSAGHYTTTKPGPKGQTLVLRDPDGVHLDGAGCILIGHAVVSEMARLYGIKVGAP